MCISDKHIKLCTCGGQIPVDNYWELFRPSGSLYVVGDLVEPTTTQDISIELLEAKLAADLNQYHCFDFEITPENGDVLQLTVSGQRYSYRYEAPTHSEGAWHVGSWGLIADNLLHQGKVQLGTMG